MSDKEIEQEIQAKGLTAPRVTPQHIESVIDGEYYFTAEDGVLHNIRQQDELTRLTGYHDSLKTLTFCVLHLKTASLLLVKAPAPARRTSTLKSAARLPAKMRSTKSGCWKAIC